MLTSRAGAIFPARTQLVDQREVEEVFYRKFVRGAFWLIHGRRMAEVPVVAGLLPSPQFDALVASLPKGPIHRYARERESEAFGVHRCAGRPAISEADWRRALDLGERLARGWRGRGRK